MNITKPTNCSVKQAMKFVKENEEYLYNQFIKIENSEDSNHKRWETGEKISYKGEAFTIIRQIVEENRIEISLDEEEKRLYISVPNGIDEASVKLSVDKGIKKLFRNNTEYFLETRVPEWSKITGLEYRSFRVKDAISRYGSCVPKTRALNFSSRLIMLPEHVVDSVIVHELCHIVHKNHDKDFYNLVKVYIPDYDEIKRWLKKNNNLINF